MASVRSGPTHAMLIAVGLASTTVTVSVLSSKATATTPTCEWRE